MERHVYVDCPVCHERVMEPFYRFCGVDVHLHRRAGRPHCRIAVAVDPNGDDHRAWPLPDGMSLEDGLVWVERRAANTAMDRAA